MNKEATILLTSQKAVPPPIDCPTNSSLTIIPAKENYFLVAMKFKIFSQTHATLPFGSQNMQKA
jgi:hypothetical protein